MYINIEQVIDIYNDLIDVKHCANGVNEILVTHLVKRSGQSEEEKIFTQKKIAEDYHSICHIFSKKHSIKIFIDGFELHEWISKIRNEELKFENTIVMRMEII